MSNPLNENMLNHPSPFPSEVETQSVWSLWTVKSSRQDITHSDLLRWWARRPHNRDYSFLLGLRLRRHMSRELMTVATWYAVSPLLGHKWVILPATGPSTVDNAELRDLLEKALREGRNALLPVLCSLKWGLIYLNGENGIVTVYEDGHVRSMDEVLLTIKATLGNLALRGCLEHTGWSYSRRSLFSSSVIYPTLGVRRY